ncbi:cache domain-containing protein [Methylobacterium organophilum]|uniref:methyl-accepting chemotaxis protein n=1 Tax=Methylobacterium organophilum TaxID=410 RepID=UPI001F12ED8B|nr:cache domain-containing protein [Methylobacterium organophilum]UMY15727.1 cache domain-containing protein [Methylobacterium organophilum]
MLRINLPRKLYALVALAGLSLIILGGTALYYQFGTMFQQRVNRIELMTEAAVNLIDRYHALAEKGEMSAAAAQSEALKNVVAMRFDHDGYFFVMDEKGRIRMHIKPEMIGTDLSDQADANGFRFVADVLPRARQEGHAQVSYAWVRPGENEPTTKIAVFRYHKPWGLYVATGVHIGDLNTAIWEQIKRLSLIGVGIMIALAAVSGLIIRSIIRPNNRLLDAMGVLATGETGVALEEAKRSDEIGAMARAVLVFRDNAIERQRLEREQAAEQERRNRRAILLDSLIGGFESTVGGSLATINDAASNLQSTAQAMTASATQTASQSNSVAAAAQQASGNVQTVAAAAEELGTSVEEIGRQVAGSARLAQTAVGEADSTAHLVQLLSQTSTKIGDMVGLISTIASQTNLLALNATIEAARAGEAGRGFAVVAAEVKELANQTGRATDEISQQITEVQSVTEQAVRAIAGIATRIREIDSVAVTIAAAVEQQGAATQEIARNVAQASVGTGEVTTNIAGVAQASGETGAAASQVLASASELSRQSTHLGHEVNRFLEGVRAA